MPSAFLLGPLKNVKLRALLPYVDVSKSTRSVTCLNRFPHTLGTLLCSEAVIDLFRAGGIIIAQEVEEAGSHFPLCYTCVIGVWLS